MLRGGPVAEAVTMCGGPNARSVGQTHVVVGQTHAWWAKRTCSLEPFVLEAPFRGTLKQRGMYPSPWADWACGPIRPAGIQTATANARDPQRHCKTAAARWGLSTEKLQEAPPPFRSPPPWGHASREKAAGSTTWSFPRPSSGRSSAGGGRLRDRSARDRRAVARAVGPPGRRPRRASALLAARCT